MNALDIVSEFLTGIALAFAMTALFAPQLLGWLL